MSWVIDFLDQAACRDQHPSLFCGPGSDVGETEEEQEQRVARAIAVCASCPVQPECRDYKRVVWQRGEPTGVWHGDPFEVREGARKKGLRHASEQRRRDMQREGQAS